MRTYAKKGSLELSINAIVVLVLAITMLGIGIMFTRNLFTDIKFDLTVDLPDATREAPVSLGYREMDFVIKGKTKLNSKIYNTLTDSIPSDVLPSIKCNFDPPGATGGGALGDQIVPTVTTGSNIQPGESGEYFFVVDGANLETLKAVTSGTYPCKVVMCNLPATASKPAAAVSCYDKDAVELVSKGFIMNVKSA